ncbi:MAG: hypothetical protein IPN34_02520 [Planctomycetes bacterium]|nr:hypothetical protein [Planctomycetota bacterium]
MTSSSEDAPESRRERAVQRPRSKRGGWRTLYARAQPDPGRLCVSIGAVLWTVYVAVALDVAAGSMEEPRSLAMRMLRFLPLLALAGYLSAPAVLRSLARSTTRVEDAALAVSWNVVFGIVFAALLFVDACLAGSGAAGAASSLGAASRTLAGVVRSALTWPFALSLLHLFALSYVALRWMRRQPSSEGPQVEAPPCEDERERRRWPTSYTCASFGTGCAWILVLCALNGGDLELRDASADLLRIGGGLVFLAACFGLTSVLAAGLFERHLRTGMTWSARLGTGLGLAAVRSSCAVPLLVLLLSAVEGVDPLRSIGWAGMSLWVLWTTLVVVGILGLAQEPLLVVGLMTLACTFAVAEVSLLGFFAQNRASRACVRRRPA